jgi:hypothetical protein
MEDAFHCNSDSMVVSVDRFWVVRPAGWVERLSGGQEGFDSFVSEDEQRSHCSEPGWERLVATGVADPADDLFAAEFLQIIRGVAGAVLAWALFTECAYASGDIGPWPCSHCAAEVSDVSSGNSAADTFGPKGVHMNALTPGAVSRRDNAAMGPNSASPSPQPRSDSYRLARRDARGLFVRLFLPG